MSVRTCGVLWQDRAGNQSFYVIRRKKDFQYWTGCDRERDRAGIRQVSTFSPDATLCFRATSRDEAERFSKTIARHTVYEDGLNFIVGEVEIVHVQITVEEIK